MKTEKTAITTLSVTAVLLLLAVVFLPGPAVGEISAAGGDYAVATFPAAGGNDVIYIADTRNGVIGVFGVDPATRQIAPRAMMPLQNAFMGR